MVENCSAMVITETPMFVEIGYVANGYETKSSFILSFQKLNRREMYHKYACQSMCAEA